MIFELLSYDIHMAFMWDEMDENFVSKKFSGNAIIANSICQECDIEFRISGRIEICEILWNAERCMKRWIFCIIRFWDFWDLMEIDFLWNLPMFLNFHWSQISEWEIGIGSNQILWMNDLIWMIIHASLKYSVWRREWNLFVDLKEAFVWPFAVFDI
jgi:hypothetical protein